MRHLSVVLVHIPIAQKETFSSFNFLSGDQIDLFWIKLYYFVVYIISNLCPTLFLKGDKLFTNM